MRLFCILLLSILLSCLSIQTHALNEGDIAEPSIRAPNMDMPSPIATGPASPTPISTVPNMDMPKTEPKPLSEPNNNQVQTTPTGNVSSNQTTTQASQEPQPMDVSGRWSIKFDGKTDRSLDLNLWSSGGDRILGYGTLTEKGSKHSVTASGSVAEQELRLATKSATPVDVAQRFDDYDLDLFMVNNTLSGTYVLRSGGQSIGEGKAIALKQQ